MIFLPLSIETVRKGRVPKATLIIIAVNVFWHLWCYVLAPNDWMSDEWFRHWFVFNNAHPNILSIFFSLFTHGDQWHLIFNMFYFWVFCWILEDRLGSIKIATIYLISGVGEALMEVVMVRTIAFMDSSAIEGWRSIGSSGAIFGLMGLALARYHQVRVRVLNPVAGMLVFGFLGLVCYGESESFGVSALVFPLLVYMVLLVRHWVFRVPLWAFSIFYFSKEYLTLFSKSGLSDGIGHFAHAFGFLIGLGVGYLLHLPEENQQERTLAQAREDRTQKLYDYAVDGYQRFLRKQPKDPDAQFEMAETYESAMELDSYRKRGWKEKALFYYQKTLGLWLDSGRTDESMRLFRRLQGAFGDCEFNPDLVRRIQEIGYKDPRNSLDNKVRRPVIEEEIRNACAERHYPAAYAAFGEWWKLGRLEDSDAAFLTIVADLCNRQGDMARGDLLEEYLAEHGTPVQAARALRILYKRWFGTPKQVRLNDLCRHVLNLHPELKDDQEIDEMERKLVE